MIYAKPTQGAMQQPVRQAAISFLGVLRMYVGPSLLSLFDEEKPALLATIKEKFAEVRVIWLFSAPFSPTTLQVEGQSAPAATKFERDGKPQASSQSGSVGAQSVTSGAAQPAPDMMDDLIPRVDISGSLMIL